MKKLSMIMAMAAALFAASAHAQAVNNRTFTIDPLPAPLIGVPAPTEWRLYCSTGPDTTTWNKATALTKTTLLPAVTTGVVALADTITHCAATFAGAGAIEGAYSNVLYAKPFGSPVIHITMDISILFENLAAGVNPIPSVKVNGVTVTAQIEP